MMRWPTEKMPPTGAPPIRWARWYRDVMGWIVLPTRCQEDLDGYHSFTMRGLRAKFYDRHERHPYEEEVATLRAQADEETAKVRKAPLVAWLERT